MNRSRFAAALAILLGLALWALPAKASSHLWEIVEVYTNHDGSVQFIELATDSAGQSLVNGQEIRANSDGAFNTFTFGSNTPASTSNKRLLLATSGFAALQGGVAPDFTLPSSLPGGFFNPNATNITIYFVNADSVTFAGPALPKNGVDSLHFTVQGNAFAGVNTPTNFAGSVGSVNLPAFATPAGDFDGDGRSDVLWRNAASGQNYLYPLDGLAILGTEGYLRTVSDPSWQIVGAGDFDGDGKADVLWRHGTTGENYVYFMDGTTIKPTEGYIRTVADQDWQVAGVGDFNGDGRDDILWRNADTGENYLYPMDGLAILPEEGYLRTVADPDWSIAGVGDFDGDFRADILWRNASTGENYLYPMNGTAIKPMEGYLRTVADLSWKVAGVGDFDGDGKADILWRNSASGENYLYPMTGNAIKPTEGYLRSVADQNWQVKGTGDYDGDGKADVLWRNSLSGENYLYPMDGTTIKPTEGYLRTVADLDWEIAGAGNSAETVVCAGACEIPGEGGCMPAPPGTDPNNACGGTYVCDGSGTSCPTSCVSDDGCSATRYCTEANVCVLKLPSESPCSGNNQCASGVCSGFECQ